MHANARDTGSIPRKRIRISALPIFAICAIFASTERSPCRSKVTDIG
jgi:hypothetical protein